MKLIDMEIASWMIGKLPDPFTCACINGNYCFEVTKETEKAIQIRIWVEKPVTLKQQISGTYETSKWFQWLPKSAIEVMPTK